MAEWEKECEGVAEAVNLPRHGEGGAPRCNTTSENGRKDLEPGRLFNLREGFSKKDDRLPPRFSQETLPRGHSKNRAVDLQPLLEEYYRLRGWDVDGMPTKKKLKELRLKQTIGDERCDCGMEA